MTPQKHDGEKDVAAPAAQVPASARPGDELSEDQLKQVAGGDYSAASMDIDSSPGTTGKTKTC